MSDRGAHKRMMLEFEGKFFGTWSQQAFTEAWNGEKDRALTHASSRDPTVLPPEPSPDGGDEKKVSKRNLHQPVDGLRKVAVEWGLRGG